jgi:hypothetical protein
LQFNRARGGKLPPRTAKLAVSPISTAWFRFSPFKVLVYLSHYSIDFSAGTVEVGTR